MKAKNIAVTFIAALAASIIAVYAYSKFVPRTNKVIMAEVKNPFTYAGYEGELAPGNLNFINAAQNSVEAVVHVKTQSTRYSYNPILEFFYGDGYSESMPVVGFGSGVIISPDGYIVTNNHVIDKSEQVFVTLNDKREYEAKLIGADPSTDLALLKISEDDLHYIPWGDSDKLQVGEWVLAVGNPFNLTSTVTAGIVSAKSKSLGIIQDQYRMESFIQTDAAVNRGNSGGALVDVNGNLVGINTAIISPSGGYAGISFAVPAAIVKKVVLDLIEFGAVQRAILGVSIQDINADLAEENGIEEMEGVYIADVREDGAAKAAGIRSGDIILSIDGAKVNSSGELQEQVSRYRPSDKVDVVIKRDGETKHIEVTLRNLQGQTNYVSNSSFDDVLGAKFETVDKKEKEKLGITHGVKIVELKAGKLRAEGVKEGFIITQINNKPVYSIEELEKIIKGTRGGVFIEGVYPNGVVQYYAIGL